MKLNENKFFLLTLLGLAFLGIILISLSPTASVNTSNQIVFAGETMGTTYEVQLAGIEMTDSEILALKIKVDNELIAVNQAMSTYIPYSEISRFNRLEPGIWMPIGYRFKTVLDRSLTISEQTEGVFEPTLGPLINLWGFGEAGAREQSPSPQQIADIQNRIGLRHVKWGEQGVQKTHSQVALNLSAIAKGYGVDQVAKLLQAQGFEHIYVEIGGELYCQGVNGAGIPWRIGIQVPSAGGESRALKIISLENAGLATSGDYQNYVPDETGLRHHLLDPRTGRPTRHTTASVSVLAADCMSADAFSTAFFVMGTEEGLALAERMPGIEALFIDREDHGFKLSMTPGFENVVVPVP